MPARADRLRVLATTAGTAAVVREHDSALLTLLVAGTAGVSSAVASVALLRRWLRPELEVVLTILRHGPRRPSASPARTDRPPSRSR